MEFLVVSLVEFAERHGFYGRCHYGGRRHDILGMEFVEFEERLDNLPFLGLEHAFFNSYVDHGAHLFAADGKRSLVVADEGGDAFGNPDHGEGDDDEHADNARGAERKVAPVGGTDGLGDNFGEDEDADGESGRNVAYDVAAENLGSLCAHCCRTHGIGNGVERKDGGDGAVDVGLVFFQNAGNAVPFLFFLCGKGYCGAQEHCLKYAAHA